MQDVTGSRYSFLRLHPDDEWVTVYGGDLPVAIDVRIGRADDGRGAVTGLRVGVGVRAEVTANVLRKIRPAEILADYWVAFAPYSEEAMMETLAAASETLPAGRGPDDETLRAFAEAYKTELARQPHRAMTAAARARNISRATAHRYAAMCRERGYLQGGEVGLLPEAAIGTVAGRSARPGRAQAH